MRIAMETAWLSLRHTDGAVSRGKNACPAVQPADIAACAGLAVAQRPTRRLAGYKVAAARRRGSPASPSDKGRRRRYARRPFPATPA